MKRSKFNLTHTHLMTANMGKLIPFALIPTLPGDIFRLKMQAFIRANPMLAPIMHDIKFYTQWWYVPYRILWDDWVAHITGGETGTEAYNFPQVDSGEEGFAVGSLADYFGFPTDVPNLKVSAMPFRAYAEIWNTRYRDEDLQDEVAISYDEGTDTITNADLLSPSWRKDYFTTSRNSTQRGNEISVPIASATSSSAAGYYCNLSFTITVSDKTYTISTSSVFNASTYALYNSSRAAISGYTVQASEALTNAVRTSILAGTPDFSYTGTLGDIFSNLGNIDSLIGGNNALTPDIVSGISLSTVATFTYSNVSSVLEPVSNSVSLSLGTGTYWTMPIAYVTSFTGQFSSGGTIGSLDIRTLRTASAMQRFQEKSLYYGNRYEEMLQREFGVRPRDSRIQRPEYIGGSMSTLQIGEVFNNTDTADSPLGSYAGYGVGAMSDRMMNYRSVEHGVIIGILSIRPAPVYMNGINREWLKTNRLDFFFPEFANIGMQEVWSGEIYARGSDNDKQVFGFSERYQEYRKMNPFITGDFRRNDMKHWHLGRDFSEMPFLNDNFINMAHSTDTFSRIFAVLNQEVLSQFMMLTKNQIVAYRPVPKRAKNLLK